MLSLLKVARMCCEWVEFRSTGRCRSVPVTLSEPVSSVSRFSHHVPWSPVRVLCWQFCDMGFWDWGYSIQVCKCWPVGEPCTSPVDMLELRFAWLWQPKTHSFRTVNFELPAIWESGVRMQENISLRLLCAPACWAYSLLQQPAWRVCICIWEPPDGMVRQVQRRLAILRPALRGACLWWHVGP